MRYFLAHLDDSPNRRWQESDPHEEIYVFPFGARTAIAVPIGALGRMLPILEEATMDLPAPCCPDCGVALPAPGPPPLGER